MSLLVRLWATLLALLAAPRCAVCRSRGEAPLCAGCDADFRPLRGRLCRICSDASPSGRCGRCQAHMPLYDGVVARFEHRGRLRQALYRLKFRGRRRLGQALGQRLAQDLTLPWRVDMIVPVPLHARRLAERGYNQAELLARPVAECLGLPLVPSALVRLQSTHPQYQKAAGSRQANVAGAFVARDVEGCTVLLVDDIMTTGATLNACALALRRAGARTVYALTLSRVLQQTARRQVA